MDLLSQFVAHASAVNCVALGKKSGVVFATGGDDHKVNIWRVGKTVNVLSFNGHKSEVDSLAFDRREQVVCSGSRRGTVKLWDLGGARLYRTLKGHRAACTAINFHLLGDFLVTGSLDSNIKVWDYGRSKQEIHTYKGHEGAVNRVVCSPDGRWVVSGGEDGKARLWDLTAGKEVKSFECLHRSAISDVAFHPTEFLLSTCSQDRTVKLWDMDDFSLIQSTPRDVNALRRLCFAPNGNYLLSGSDDQMRVWSCENFPMKQTSSFRGSWKHLQDVHALQEKDETDRFIICGSDKEVVSIWLVDMQMQNEINRQNKAKYTKTSSKSARGKGKNMKQTQKRDKANEQRLKQRDDERKRREQKQRDDERKRREQKQRDDERKRREEKQREQKERNREEKYRVQEKVWKERRKIGANSLIEPNEDINICIASSPPTTKKSIDIQNKRNTPKAAAAAAARRRRETKETMMSTTKTISREEKNQKSQINKLLYIESKKAARDVSSSVEPTKDKMINSLDNLDRHHNEEKQGTTNTDSTNNNMMISSRRDYIVNLDYNDFLSPPYNNANTMDHHIQLEICHKSEDFIDEMNHRLNIVEPLKKSWNNGNTIDFIKQIKLIATAKPQQIIIDIFTYADVSRARFSLQESCALLSIIPSIFQYAHQSKQPKVNASYCISAIQVTRALISSHVDYIRDTLNIVKDSEDGIVGTVSSQPISFDDRIRRCKDFISTVKDLHDYIYRLTRNTKQNSCGHVTRHLANALDGQIRDFLDKVK